MREIKLVFEPKVHVAGTIGKEFVAIMARPVPGEWIEDEFAGIAVFGIDSVISLLETDESIELGLGQERKFCEKNNG